ncbi:MAG: hypothetical protein GY711_03115 [bacterium]|nr:hypothetical protein [bacterium]
MKLSNLSSLSPSLLAVTLLAVSSLAAPSSSYSSADTPPPGFDQVGVYKHTACVNSTWCDGAAVTNCVQFADAFGNGFCTIQ